MRAVRIAIVGLSLGLAAVISAGGAAGATEIHTGKIPVVQSATNAVIFVGRGTTEEVATADAEAAMAARCPNGVEIFREPQKLGKDNWIVTIVADCRMT
ncbi:hypothetical protein [Streptomyces sp. NRRL F-2664]|uniref:hypothetical protein n=1 Tax=Streptomyces sp. NRRL F-2664 TaxID=1463842 RepID=UPI00131E2330|nr:hypothetical protein [Streptomyces sp. NRRL F-2664]